jgi:putative transposase
MVLYRERHAKPRRASDATRLGLVFLARCFAWKEALLIVQPATLIRWHRQGFHLHWRWKSTPGGRPRVPAELRKLIGKMAEDNPTWGEKQIATELLLKLGLRMSPRTVRRYMPKGSVSKGRPPSQRWSTFVRNYAQAMLAFCVTASRSTSAPAWRVSAPVALPRRGAIGSRWLLS